MKIFLSSLAIAATFGIWMVVVASSQLALLDEATAFGKTSNSSLTPVTSYLKQDRLGFEKPGFVQTTSDQKSDLCSLGGLERACKFHVSDLKVSPPLVAVK